MSKLPEIVEKTFQKLSDCNFYSVGRGYVWIHKSVKVMSPPFIRLYIYKGRWITLKTLEDFRYFPCTNPIIKNQKRHNELAEWYGFSKPKPFSVKNRLK